MIVNVWGVSYFEDFDKVFSNDSFLTRQGWKSQSGLKFLEIIFTVLMLALKNPVCLLSFEEKWNMPAWDWVI